MFRTKLDRQMQQTQITLTGDKCAQAISHALRRVAGHQPSAVKTLSRWIKRDPRAVKNWWEGTNSPQTPQLIELMREFDEVYEAVMELSGRSPSGSSSDPQLQKKIQQALQILSGEGQENGNNIN